MSFITTVVSPGVALPPATSPSRQAQKGTGHSAGCVQRCEQSRIVATDITARIPHHETTAESSTDTTKSFTGCGAEIGQWAYDAAHESNRYGFRFNVVLSRIPGFRKTYQEQIAHSKSEETAYPLGRRKVLKSSKHVGRRTGRQRERTCGRMS